MAPKQHLHFALCRLIDDMGLVVACLIGDKSERKCGEFRRFYCCLEGPWRVLVPKIEPSERAGSQNGNNMLADTGLCNHII